MSDAELNENSELAELEQLLDGELPESQAQACAGRVAESDAISEVLHKLQADRDLRGQVSAQCLPSPQAAEAFSRGAVRAARRLAWQARWNRAVRVTGAAAACILVGFITGWSGRGTAVPSDARNIRYTGPINRGPVVPVADLQGGGAYYVELTDAAGHPVAVQRFDNRDEAEAFARDLNHTQSTPASTDVAMPLAPTQPQARHPLVVPVSDGY